MGYVVIVKLDSYYEVINCDTDAERDDAIKIWTNNLTNSYWGRNTATITVYPDQVVEQHEFEIDQVKSKVNNCFKIKRVFKPDLDKSDGDSTWVNDVDRQSGAFTDPEIANSRTWK